MNFLSDITVDASIISTRTSAEGAPFSVVSNILNTNLNADLLDGQHGSYYLNRNNHTGFQAISTITGLQTALDQWGGNIPDGSDLNTYVTSNNYGIPTHSGAATLVNAPTNRAGMLEVYKSASFVYQLYRGLNSEKMFYRSSTSTSSITSPWYTIATEDFVTSRGYTIVTGITNGNIPRWAGTSFGDSLLSQFGSSINVNGWLQIGTATDYKQMFLGQATAGTLYFQGISGFSDNMYWLSYDASGIGFSVGGVLNNAFLISRSNGAASFAVSPSGPTPTTGLHLTNKTYVDGLISGKENSFSKGDIIAGTGISVTGTYTGRLVGPGNLTINSTLIDRFINSTAEASHLDLITQGGVKAWTITAANRPESYGTAFTFVGLTSTGNGASAGTLINQILAGSSGELYWRQSIGDWNTWSSTYQIWTSKHFTAANVANGQAAYTALSGKENVFSKGDLVAGTGVTLSGTLTGRLVGAGSITINATATGSGSWQDSLAVNNVASSMPIISRGTATTVLDYLQLKPTDYGTGKPYLALSKNFIANKWEWYCYDGVSTTGNLNFALNLTRFDVPLVDENRSISAGTGLSGGGPLSANRTLSVVYGTTSGTAAEGSALTSGLAGKENSFSKGSFVAGTGVTLSGFITNRLVGAGDITINASTGSGGTVTSVGMTAPSGFYVSSGPITSSGNITLEFASGYSLPTTGKQGVWDGYQSQIDSKMSSDRTITFNGNVYNLNSNPNLGSSGGGVSGSGTSAMMPLWNGSASLTNSFIYNGTNILGQREVIIGDTGTSANLTVQGLFNLKAVTASQKAALTVAFQGAMVYQTDGTEGVWMYKSSGWAFVG